MIDRDAPGPGSRMRREYSGSLGNNIKHLVTNIEIEKLEERKRITENLRRITSVEIMDPYIEELEAKKERELRGEVEKLERIMEELDEEFKRLLEDLGSSK